MPYTLPKFVNRLDRWIHPSTPFLAAPNFTDNLYQIYAYSKQGNFWRPPGLDQSVPVIIIREPPAPPQGFAKSGDILGKDVPVFTDYPLLYLVLWKQRLHSGFPNAYQALFCAQCERDGNLLLQVRP